MAYSLFSDERLTYSQLGHKQTDNAEITTPNNLFVFAISMKHVHTITEDVDDNGEINMIFPKRNNVTIIKILNNNELYWIQYNKQTFGNGEK